MSNRFSTIRRIAICFGAPVIGGLFAGCGTGAISATSILRAVADGYPGKVDHGNFLVIMVIVGMLIGGTIGGLVGWRRWQR